MDVDGGVVKRPTSYHRGEMWRMYLVALDPGYQGFIPKRLIISVQQIYNYYLQGFIAVRVSETRESRSGAESWDRRLHKDIFSLY